MVELPSGTVAFLFTDVEGSTRLLKQLGERYAEVLDEQQRLLRAAFVGHGGQEIDTQGDSFFVAFRRAKDAVAAAVAAQRALAAHRWPDGLSVRVRMGIHTGEPSVGGERYVGFGVHRAARVSAAGHGGQVLVSNATRELIADDLPEGVSLRDLGEYRLKDIDRPERLFQLVVEGLPAQFPPLKAPPVRRRIVGRGSLLAGAAAGVIVAAVAIPLFALSEGSGAPKTVAANSVAVIDPHSNSVVRTIPVGARPVGVVNAGGAVWVANLDDQSISRIDSATFNVVRTIPLQSAPSGLAADQRMVWVVAGSSTGSGTLAPIDAEFNTVRSARNIPTSGLIPDLSPSETLAFGDLWVVDSSGVVLRIDPATGRMLASVDVGNNPTAIAAGAGAVWVANADDGTVSRIDLTNVVTATIPVGHGPSAIVVGAGAVWVVDALDGSLVRIDAASNAVTATLHLGKSPSGVVADAGGVWVVDSAGDAVIRVDPRRGTIVKTIPLGGSPQGMALVDGQPWVTVAQPPPAAPANPSGVLRLNLQADLSTDDPALAGDLTSFQLFYATCAKLLNYPDKAGLEGAQLVPEVAQAVPSPSADGKSYTFRIRPGFRFSPPSNEPVTAATFKYTIERTLSPKMHNPYMAQLVGDLAGERAFESGKASHISGIVARGDTLTIRLTKAAPTSSRGSGSRRSAPSRRTHRSTRKACRRSPPPAPTTSRPTPRTDGSFSSATPTTAAPAPDA